MIKKSLAFIFRNNYSELLCFVHPATNWLEVIRGTVDGDESPEETIRREMEEEAGLQQQDIADVKFLGDMVLWVNSGYDAKGLPEEQTYFGFLVELRDEQRPPWVHKVVSDGIDNGHVYAYEWKQYNNKLMADLNPFIKEFMVKKITKTVK
jgi:8-oxo-dGTP pyrophosphatase MutT (NUDIX family)